jgi:hypothetical protein
MSDNRVNFDQVLSTKAGGHDTGVGNRLLAELVSPTVPRSEVSPTPEPKSYLDKALGTVIHNDKTEHYVAQAVKTGAMFFGGKVGLASTVALYALDQAKVGDSFGQAVTDLGLGAIKGVGMRGINNFAASRDMGIASQAITLGVGARVMDSGLNRNSWLDHKTGAYTFGAGLESLKNTATDKQALISDVTTFAIGGAFAHGINGFSGKALNSSAFWRTTTTGAAFGMVTGADGEVRREREQGEAFSLAKIIGAGAKEGAWSAAAMLPAAMQAKSGLRNYFVESHGIDTFGEKGNYVYKTRADGKIHNVLSTSATNSGLREAEETFNRMRENQKNHMAESFGISIARGGETIHYEGGSGTKDIQAREPRLNEMLVLQRVLERSAPGYLSADGKVAAKFNFVNEADTPSKHSPGWVGLYEYRNGNPNVFFNNSVRDEPRMTERDPDRYGRDDGYKRNSFEVTVTHEIAHNSDRKVREADPELERDIQEKLGWQRFKTDKPEHHEFDEFLLKDKEGGLWRFNIGNRWVLSNPQGEPIKADGTPATSGQEVHIGNDEMRYKSLYRPSSEYFNKPMEMLMEGYARFRIGGETRAALLHNCPEVYEQVRRQEEAELIMHYGKGADGRSTMVRMPDGNLADRNQAHEQTIAEFEAAARANASLAHYDRHF